MELEERRYDLHELTQVVQVVPIRPSSLFSHRCGARSVGYLLNGQLTE